MSLLTKLPHSKKIIVGLNKCLWPFSVDKDRVSHAVNPTVKEYVREKNMCLKNLKRDGCKLYIASRSSNPRVCSMMLGQLYPEIAWDGMAIFNSSSKLRHVQRLVRHGETFCMFDHNHETLTRIKKTYGDRCKVFLPCGMQYTVYREMELII